MGVFIKQNKKSFTSVYIESLLNFFDFSPIKIVAQRKFLLKELKQKLGWAYHHLITEFIIERVWEKSSDWCQTIHNIEGQTPIVSQHHQQWSHVGVNLINFYGSSFQELQESAQLRYRWRGTRLLCKYFSYNRFSWFDFSPFILFFQNAIVQTTSSAGNIHSEKMDVGSTEVFLTHGRTFHKIIK